MRALALFLVGISLMLGCAAQRSVIKPERLAPKVKNLRIENVRVLLNKNVLRINISAIKNVEIFNLQNQSKIMDARLNRDTQFFIQNGAIACLLKVMPTPAIRIVPYPGDYIRVHGKRYRGQIEVLLDSQQNSLRVLNYVPIEDYLKGVISNEVSPLWPREALKAQVVASRTFTLSRMNNSAKQSYDVESNTNSQVYGGVDTEKPATNEAVDSTQGLIATFQGRFISAFYHSNCGGRTANVQDIWGNNISYLQGSPCGFCDDCPHAQWATMVDKKKLLEKLQQHNLRVNGEISSLELSGRDNSGRVTSLLIKYSGGEESIKAPVFRMIVGADEIRSTIFYIQTTDRSFLFKGKGWGHGVGLCQEGAYGMARAGYTFEQILKRYYPGITISLVEN